MVTGIDAALAVPHDPARLRIGVFVTDGYVGDEDEVLRSVAQRMKDARLFSFGVGTAVNRYLLEELAAIGRGAAHIVRPDESSAAAVDAFERRIARPVLTDLRLDWGGLAVTDVSPWALPDLFAGQPLVLAGHYTAPGAGVVTVRGKQAGREVSFQVPVKLPILDAARPAVAALWARQRIAELSRQLVRAADPALQREVLALALEHRLLTPYTAFVAVDEARATAGGAPKKVVVPVVVPDSVRGIVAEDWGSAGFTYVPSVGFRSGGSFGSGGGSFGSIGGSFGSISGSYGGDVVAEINAARDRPAPRRPVPRAAVVIPPPIVVGELHKDIVRRYVRRRQHQLTYCYEKELLASPKLGGTVTARFTISEGGHVSAATATGVGNAAVESCIAEVLKSIEFPRPQGGPVLVTYAIQLQPPAPESP
jgi:Ca-activated chloride channel family protein